MSQNSCQPEGLQPESALASLLVLAIERLLPSPGASPSPILAATHTCFIRLGTPSARGAASRSAEYAFQSGGVTRQVVVALGFGRAHKHRVAEFGIVLRHSEAAKYALRLQRLQHAGDRCVKLHDEF